ncbi:MAG TPA: RNA 2',3'-cyclic phosphodiesterase [Bryobacteraceae bacterium]|nr:RNA 2',3'-cyclic phosphodiesterase [Bryobacteraceae bacterium]
MRLFTGISIDPQVLNALKRALAELRPTARLKWSPVENLHITTKFIGEWPEARLPELETALARVEGPGDIRIDISRFGFYPNPHRPRVFFAGVHGGEELPDLARRIDDAVAALGVAREDRAYSPHLTLARIKTEDIRGLREHIASMTNFNFGSFTAIDFHLYLSTPGKEGSVYTTLASYPLARPTSL